VAGSKVGAVGFCMGGRLALTSAATYRDRFAAVASFHGGHLATDAPDSPHLLAQKLKAEIYVAAAENDAMYPSAMAERLEKALTEARVKHRAETYAGAAHGWMVPDFPTYDAASAQRGWTEMLALFQRTLNK
jgi:carboxymethylenebutenolidase